MTQTTWMARDRPHGLSTAHQIHEVYNRIPGHQTPEEHVRTVFDQVLPKLLHPKARYWIVGLMDGAEHFVKYMDGKLVVNIDHDLGERVSGFAFMQPTHDPVKVETETMRRSLHTFGKCWIKCDAPKGRFLNSPNGTHPFKGSSPEDSPPSSDENVQKENAKPGDAEDAKAREAAEALVAMRQGGMENLGPEPQHETDSEDEDEVGGVPVVVERAGNALSESINLASGQGSFESPKSLEGWAGDPPQLSKQSLDSLNSAPNLGPRATTTAPPSPALTSEKGAEVDTTELKQSISDLNIRNEEGERRAAEMTGNYDPKSERVSCPTFSSEVTDFDELIFGNVIDDVLEWFQQYARGLALPGQRAMDVEMAGRDMEMFARTR